MTAMGLNEVEFYGGPFDGKIDTTGAPPPLRIPVIGDDSGNYYMTGLFRTGTTRLLYSWSGLGGRLADPPGATV